MILYYIEYTSETGKPVVEVFKSRSNAKKRVSDITKVYKQVTKAWQEWVITRRNKPGVTPVEPPEIKEASFDLNSEGVMHAFTYLINRGK